MVYEPAERTRAGSGARVGGVGQSAAVPGLRGCRAERIRL